MGIFDYHIQKGAKANNEALAVSPDLYNLLFRLGILAIFENKPDLALNMLNAVYNINGESEIGCVAKMQSDRLSQNFSSMHEFFNNVAYKKYPESLNILLNYALCLLDANMISEARKILTTISELETDDKCVVAAKKILESIKNL
jgi:hypothetical protein